MKTIKVQAIIEGIRSRKDRSLGLSLTTPELSIQEKALFMEMQSVPLDLTLTPLDEQAPEYKVDKDLDQKSQAQRIRSVLYILFSRNPEDMDFETYYKVKTEKYIEYLKSKIE